MTFLFLILIFGATIGGIAYPLFFQKLQNYRIVQNRSYSPGERILSALSELENDYQMGRLGKKEYQQQKIKLQREYLALKQQTVESLPSAN